MMNIILFGPQGCGKGTQADIITKNFGMHHFSMGDELRLEIKRGTPLGKRIARIINKGALVPDSISNKLLMNVARKYKSMIFDGYPRRDSQLRFIMKNFDIDAVIEIDISQKESIRRIASRRICTRCGKGYNLIWLKPKVKGICDIDGAPLKQRDDDKMAEVIRRLKIYNKDTMPLRKYYKKAGILHVINGEQSIKNVARDIGKVLKKIK